MKRTQGELAVGSSQLAVERNPAQLPTANCQLPTPPGGLRSPGAILLISCYELGHQPLGTAMPLAFLERAGFRPATLDVAVEPLDAEKVARARFIGIAVPMHTALRLGVRVAERVRELHPAAVLCFYGLS